MLNADLRIDGIATKSLVCEACWGNLFTFDAFQVALATEVTPESKGFSYTTSWDAIRASIEKGCNWCNLLSGPAKNGFGECTITVTFSKESKGYTPEGVKVLTLKYNGKNGVINIGSSSYRLYTTADDNASQIIRPRDRVLQVSAPSSYKLALECLDRCIKSHDKCPKERESTLPDRVIDCSNLERVKIVVTNNVPGIYATLSYVWGRSQTLVATTKNIDSFIKDGIETKLFPPTIQHALISAHNLGMRYVWIDALCILQDSDEDKGRQIGMMNKIYTNGYFTIIAACANGVDEGFLQDRPPRIPSAHIPFICPDGKVGTVYLASTLMVGYDVTQMYHDEMEPANYRGWCLQERVLSKRSFIFASDTLKYQCQTETVNIGDAFCEPSTGPRLPGAFSFDIFPKLSPDELMWARRFWLFMIWEYSRRSLSRPDTDKLNALAGIAEQYHHIFHSKYYAGLWEDTFLEDLLWRRGVSGEFVPRSTTYRAPSWSWASIDTHTDAPNFESKLKPGAYVIGRCTVVECDVTLAHEPSPFAAVTGAYLKLESFVHEATLEMGESYPNLFLATDTMQKESRVGSVLLDSVEDEKIIHRVWIVPIIWDRGYSFVEALVLAAAHGGNFRRIGHFSPAGGLNWVESGTKRVITIV